MHSSLRSGQTASGKALASVKLKPKAEEAKNVYVYVYVYSNFS